MPNVGNTCFLNSSLQCVLAALFSSLHNVPNQAIVDGKAFRNPLWELMQANNQSPLFPEQVLRRVQSTLKRMSNDFRMNCSKACDPMGAFTTILDCFIRKETKTALTDDTKPVPVFGFSMSGKMTCRTCNRTHSTPTEPATMLSLPIGPSHTSLKETLNAYFSVDEKHDVQCAHCRVRREMAQVNSITTPDVLALGLKRLGHHGQTNWNKLNHTADMVFLNERYKLLGVVRHNRSLDSAHYTAVVRYPGGSATTPRSPELTVRLLTVATVCCSTRNATTPREQFQPPQECPLIPRSPSRLQMLFRIGTSGAERTKELAKELATSIATPISAMSATPLSASLSV
jgi:hypothetical protein